MKQTHKAALAECPGGRCSDGLLRESTSQPRSLPQGGERRTPEERLLESPASVLASRNAEDLVKLKGKELGTALKNCEAQGLTSSSESDLVSGNSMRTRTLIKVSEIYHHQKGAELTIQPNSCQRKIWKKEKDGQRD